MHWFLIACFISLPAVPCLSQPSACSSFSLSCSQSKSQLKTPSVSEALQYRVLPFNPTYIRTVYSSPISLQHTTIQAPSHLYAPGLCGSASELTLLSVGLHSSLRWNCLPSHESSPSNPLVCDMSVSVCVCFIFRAFFLNGIAMLCSGFGSTIFRLLVWLQYSVLHCKNCWKHYFSDRFYTFLHFVLVVVLLNKLFASVIECIFPHILP